LFRSGSEQPIRKNIIEEDLIDCIVGLGPNLFYGASIPAAIMFMSKKKNSSMKDRILFVNAEQEVTIGTAQNHLSKKNIEQIVDVVLHYKEKDLFSRIVEKEELIENDYNLNIVRYVQTTPPPPMIDIQASFQKLTVLKKQQDDEFQRFCALFLELGND
jgi:type I restriction enzyme M protein